jgi:hypothetical protein
MKDAVQAAGRVEKAFPVLEEISETIKVSSPWPLGVIWIDVV